MTIDSNVFYWLVTIATLITCVAPCVLLGLFINDCRKGKLW